MGHQRIEAQPLQLQRATSLNNKKDINIYGKLFHESDKSYLFVFLVNILQI